MDDPLKNSRSDFKKFLAKVGIYRVKILLYLPLPPPVITYALCTSVQV